MEDYTLHSKGDNHSIYIAKNKVAILYQNNFVEKLFRLLYDKIKTEEIFPLLREGNEDFILGCYKGEENASGFIMKNIFDDEDEELQFVYGNITVSTEDPLTITITENDDITRFDLDDTTNILNFKEIKIVFDITSIKYYIEFNDCAYPKFIYVLIAKFFGVIIERLIKKYSI